MKALLVVNIVAITIAVYMGAATKDELDICEVEKAELQAKYDYVVTNDYLLQIQD